MSGRRCVDMARALDLVRAGVGVTKAARKAGVSVSGLYSALQVDRARVRAAVRALVGVREGKA